MRGQWKNIFKVACMYATTVIGAGFASGQEILQFFSSYYKGGFWGILLAGLLFAAIGVIVLDKVYIDRIKDYDEFLFPVTGWFLGWVIEISVTLFMLSIFCVMTAGMATILSSFTNISFYLAATIVGFICMLFILTDIRGIVALNSVMTPLLAAGILAAGFFVIVSKDTEVFSFSGYIHAVTGNWFFSALIYVSYNTLMSVVIMSNLLPYLKTRSTGIAGGILGGAVLCAMAVIINSAISLSYPNLHGELPLLELIRKYSGTFTVIYTLVLFAAMFVSSVTSGYCVSDRAAGKTGISKRFVAVLVCAAAVPLSTLGFSRLISLLYPVFGYIGLFLVFLILLQGVKSVLVVWRRQ